MKSQIIDIKFLEYVSPNYKYMQADPSNSASSFYDNIRFSSCNRHRSDEYISYSCYKIISSISMSLFFENYGK